MTHIAKEGTRSLIIALGLPPVVLDVFDGHGPPSLLERLGCPTEYFLLSEAQQARYAPSIIAPLLDDGNGSFILAYHQEKRAFLWFSVESSTEKILGERTHSWQQVMGREFLRLWEDAIEDSELRNLAAQFHFRFIERMLDDLRGLKPGFSTSEAYEEWLARFLALIGNES